MSANISYKDYVRKNFLTCFYTGLSLDAETRSVEHLVPQNVLRKVKMPTNNWKWNIVGAHRQINYKAGDAPLAVKFAMKKFLSEIIIFPGMSPEKQIESYMFAATAFINLYRIDDVLPWRFKTKTFKKCVSKSDQKNIRAKLQIAYMELLTKEEIELGAYIK